MNHICLDYETFYIKPTASLKDPVTQNYSVARLGNWRYCNDHRFDAYMLSVYDGTETWVGSPKDLNWNALEGRLLTAHNAGFDSAVTTRLGELGITPKISNEWVCTANMTSFLCSCRSLAEALLVLEERSMNKGMRDYMNGRSWASVKDTPEGKKLAEYAATDAKESWHLFEKHGHKWPQFERDLSALTIKQGARGIAINVELLEKYLALLPIVIFNHTQTLPWVKDLKKKPSSQIAINEYCRSINISCPPIKEDDEEGYIKWETITAKSIRGWPALESGAH